MRATSDRYLSASLLRWRGALLAALLILALAFTAAAAPRPAAAQAAQPQISAITGNLATYENQYGGL